MGKKRVTIYVDGEDWKAFRKFCLEYDVSASERIADFIKMVVGGQLGEWKGGRQYGVEKPKKNDAAGDKESFGSHKPDTAGSIPVAATTDKRAKLDELKGEIEKIESEPSTFFNSYSKDKQLGKKGGKK